MGAMRVLFNRNRAKLGCRGNTSSIMVRNEASIMHREGAVATAG
jgi:hypothetical protein